MSNVTKYVLQKGNITSYFASYFCKFQQKKCDLVARQRNCERSELVTM